MMPLKKDCYNCQFNIDDGDGVMICAGRDDFYGELTPIPGVDYDECWEMSFSYFKKNQKKLESEANGDGIIV